MIVKIALVQLECHPCLTIGSYDFLSEPFVDEKPPLEHLSQFGFSDEVKDLQERCRNKYLFWHCTRLHSIIHWFEKLPLDERPDIIVFPEGAVPLLFLKCLKRHVKRTGATIFAGTHTFEASDKTFEEYKRLYGGESKDLKLKQQAELKAKDVFSQFAKAAHESLSVMPIIHRVTANQSDKEATITFRQKTHLSPLEQGGVGPKQSESVGNSFTNIRIPIVGVGEIAVLPLICSEALQLTHLTPVNRPDLVIISSYDHKPSNFTHISSMFATNQIPTAYCNDGRYGNSKIFVTPDERNPHWWFSGVPQGSMPTGDGVLIMSCTLGANAPQVGTACPIVFHRFLKLASIVPENTRVDEWQASHLLNIAYQRVLAAKKQGTPLDFEQLLRDLELRRVKKGMSQLQQLQYSRLASLLRVRNLAPEDWRALADDIFTSTNDLRRSYVVFPNKDSTLHPARNDADRGTLLPPVSLRQLEHDLALSCDMKIRYLLQSSKVATSVSYSKQVLASLATIARFTRKHKEGSVVESLATLLEARRQSTKSITSQRLINALSKIVEKYSATSGMLFLVEHGFENNSSEQSLELRSVALFNVAEPEIQRYVGKGKLNKGIVGRVCETGKAYLNNIVSDQDRMRDRVLDPFYEPSNPSTRAELCVPIYGPRLLGNKETNDIGELHFELIGVLNLESCQTGAFSTIQVNPLECEAATLAPDLQIFKYLCSPDCLVGWNPCDGNWRISPLLDEICFNISSAPKDRPGLPPLSCSVWYADWDKKVLYVRGTCRFDYEYRDAGTLSWDSFVGTLLTQSSRGRVYRGTVDDIVQFKRKEKAKRMQVHEVIATPLHKTNSLLQGGNKHFSHDDAIGILTIYSFKHDANSYGLNETFTDAVVGHLSDIIARFITDFWELREKVALSFVYQKLVQQAVPHFNELETFRSAVQECLASPWSSVFVVDGKTVRCAATSGLVGNPSDQSYELGNDSVTQPQLKGNSDFPPHINGITPFVARMRGRVIRKLDILDINEIVRSLPDEWVRVSPQNRLREAGVMSRPSHCRLLSSSIWDSNGVCGVIRLLRPQDAPPYVKSDEKLVQGLGLLSRYLFRSQTSLPFKLTQKGMPHSSVPTILSEQQRILFEEGVPTRFDQRNADENAERVTSAFRLMTTFNRLVWSQAIVESWLQDVMCFLRDYKISLNGDPNVKDGGTIHMLSVNPVFTSLRVVSVDEDLDEWLFPFAYSCISGRPAILDKARRSKKLTNIGWKSIDFKSRAGQALSVPACASFTLPEAKIYSCSVEHYEQTRSGISIPICWIGHGSFVEGVFSIDFGCKLQVSSELMTILFDLSSGLSIMGSSLRRDSLLQSVNGSLSLIKSLEKNFEWATIYVSPEYNSYGTAGEIVQSFGVVPNWDVLSRYRDTLSGVTDFPAQKDIRTRWFFETTKAGVKWSNDLLLVPLRIGGFPMCELVGKLKSATYSSILEKAGERHDHWTKVQCAFLPDKYELCCFKEMWQLAIELMEIWSVELQSSHPIFENFTFGMQSYKPANGNVDEEVGLSFWRPILCKNDVSTPNISS